MWCDDVGVECDIDTHAEGIRHIWRRKRRETEELNEPRGDGRREEMDTKGEIICTCEL